MDVFKVDLPRISPLHLSTAEDAFTSAELCKEVAAIIDPEPMTKDAFEAQAANPKRAIFSRPASWVAATPETAMRLGPNDKGKEIRLVTWDSHAESPEVVNLIAD